MRDKAEVMRGACQTCSCSEYIANKSNNKCDECNCSVSSHRQEDYGNDKKQETSIEEERSQRVISKSVASATIWLIVTLALGFYSFQHRQGLFKYKRGIADNVYLFGASNLFVMFLVSLFASGSRNLERRTLGTLWSLILGIAGSTFLTFYFRLTPQITDRNGYPVDVARYVEWTRHCAAIVLVIGYLTKARQELINRAEINSYVLMIFGTISAVTSEPWAEICCILAWCTHYMALYDTYDMFKDALEGNTECNVPHESLKLAQTATLWSSNGFGVVFCLVRYRIINYEVGEVLYILNELVAKAVFSAAIWGSLDPPASEEVTESVKAAPAAKAIKAA